MSCIKLNRVIQLFKDITSADVERPSGEIDLLIGYDYAALHPVRQQRSDNLLLLTNNFGKCIMGSHPKIIENTRSYIVSKLTTIVNTIQTKNIMADFFEFESLGVECNPKCGNCQCRKCPINGKQCTLKEERALELITNNITFDKDHWIAIYPWKWKYTYTSQINGMLNRKIARQLTSEEIFSNKGPVHYIAHHAVLKPESKTTPVRIEFNSSNNYKGHILNDYWEKGPDAFINNLFGILIKFREHYVGFIGDIKKKV